MVSIKLRQEQRGPFSFVDFYAARMRRIVAAYLMLLTLTTVVMAVPLIPRDFASYSKSLAAALYFTSNRFFAAQSEYFVPAAHELPLLHSWSAQRHWARASCNLAATMAIAYWVNPKLVAPLPASSMGYADADAICHGQIVGDRLHGDRMGTRTVSRPDARNRSLSGLGRWAGRRGKVAGLCRQHGFHGRP